MQSPVPSYLYALSSDELDALKDIFKTARNSKYFEQKTLQAQMKTGDVRNFLGQDVNPRLNAQFVAELYNHAMNILWPQAYAKEDKVLAEKCEKLYELGRKSDRYRHDVTRHMDTLISGDIRERNVPSADQKTYIGYRFHNDKRTLLRFAISIYMDKDIGRTKFWGYSHLSEASRETRGFAYYASGNVYLSGFVNGDLGCEFIAFRKAPWRYVRLGLIITTSIAGLPTAKKCALVEGERTTFKEAIDEHEIDGGVLRPKTLGKDIRKKLIPIKFEEIANERDLVALKGDEEINFDVAQHLQRGENGAATILNIIDNI